MSSGPRLSNPNVPFTQFKATESLLFSLCPAFPLTSITSCLAFLIVF